MGYPHAAIGTGTGTETGQGQGKQQARARGWELLRGWSQLILRHLFLLLLQLRQPAIALHRVQLVVRAAVAHDGRMHSQLDLDLDLDLRWGQSRPQQDLPEPWALSLRRVGLLLVLVPAQRRAYIKYRPAQCLPQLTVTVSAATAAPAPAHEDEIFMAMLMMPATPRATAPGMAGVLQRPRQQRVAMELLLADGLLMRGTVMMMVVMLVLTMTSATGEQPEVAHTRLPAHQLTGGSKAIRHLLVQGHARQRRSVLPPRLRLPGSLRGARPVQCPAMATRRRRETGTSMLQPPDQLLPLHLPLA